MLHWIVLLHLCQIVLQSFTSQHKNIAWKWKLPPWFPPYSTDHLLTLTHTYWTNMCVFNSRNFLKMNESHIIQICTRLLQKYLLWPHILLSFEYSELLLRSERITWTCASLSYCCHVEPALKESQGWCLPKVNYLLGLGANYILEIAENTGNLSGEKLKRQFLVLKDVYKNSHSSLTRSSFKIKRLLFTFSPVFPSLWTPFHWQNAEAEKTEKGEKRSS